MKNADGFGTYRMAGVPHGLGACDNQDGSLTVPTNHELGSTNGVVRDHGAKGAIVSKWKIRKSGLKVHNGEDLIKNVGQLLLMKAPN